jgi:hypothetical protein
VPTLPIVKAFDKREDRAARLLRGPEARLIQQFTLQGGKEALRQGVVVTIAGRAHGTLDPQRTTPLSEHPGRILAAMIGNGG